MIKPNPHLSNLPVYEPGRPIEDVARDFGLNPTDIIKLASNENPLGPSPKALEAIRKTLNGIYLYPDGNGFNLRNAIAQKLGVQIENVILGNGSNEIIEFLGHAYLSPQDEMVISQYAFAIYEIVGKMFQAKIIEVPALNYGHDLNRMKEAITSKTKLVFVANPNNPTGTAVSADALKTFIESVSEETLVVIDEAYQEFLTNPLDTPKLIAKHPNLVVMRTFSKAQGLAGLRIGYGIASKEVAASLQKVRQPFQANLLAQEAALAALSDHDHIRKTVQMVNEGKAFLEFEFKKRNLQFLSTSGNFILVKVGDGKKVFEELMREGIIVRPMHGYRLPEWIRVTIGTLVQNEKFVNALSKVI
jgi:histidinol-phosphate aminotransferase